MTMKDLLFSVPGLLVTLVHNLLAVGFVATWICFQVYVLGNNPMADDRPVHITKSK